MSDDGKKKNGSSAIDKILDRLGYRDGAWRRAFVSGLIFLALVASYRVPPFESLAQSAGAIDLLKNTQALVVVTLLIFATGFVVDGVSRGFVVRGVSVTTSWIDNISRLVGNAGGRSRRWWAWV